MQKYIEGDQVTGVSYALHRVPASRLLASRFFALTAFKLFKKYTVA